MRIRGALTAFFLTVLLAGPGAAQVAAPETLDDTLELMREAYVATGQFDAVEVDEAEQSVVLTIGDGSEFISYPDNLHQMLTSAESAHERQQVLDDFIQSVVEHVAALDAPNDLSMLVPVVRHREFGAYAGDAGPVSESLAGDMAVFYVFDHPGSISYVTPTHLDELGVAATDLAGIAAENVARLGWAPELEGDGLWFLVFDGTYETTFLVDAALWNGFDEQLGTVIMMALARDLILFSDAEFEGVEAHMRQFAAENFETLNYPLSDRLYEWTGTGWVERP